jgi:hypothetical protein
MGRPTVRVDANDRGDWQDRIPDRSDPVTCESLDEASRVAYLCAARMRPCQLVVRDANHRVLSPSSLTARTASASTRCSRDRPLSTATWARTSRSQPPGMCASTERPSPPSPPPRNHHHHRDDAQPLRRSLTDSLPDRDLTDLSEVGIARAAHVRGRG